jgi:hypothetical protein
MKPTALLCVLLALVLPACSGEQDHDHPHPEPQPAHDGHDHGDHGDHGTRVELGKLEIAGHAFSVARLGELEPGHEGALEVALDKAPPGTMLANLEVYAWLEDAAGNLVSPSEKGHLESGVLHFHVTPRADAGAPAKIVLRLRKGELDERGALALGGS